MHTPHLTGSGSAAPLGRPRPLGLCSLSVFLGVLFSVLALLSAGARPACAATYQVTTLADDGSAGTLRAAISAANVSAGLTITFKPGLSGTILLASGLPALTKSMTITGPGASVIAVDGSGKYRPFLVNIGVTAALSGLTIQHGDAGNGNGNGGGVLNNGVLTLTGCTLTGSTAQDGGGGVYNSGTLRLTGCTLTGNSATQFGGGGVYNAANSTATLTGCTLTGNLSASFGGGVLTGGTVTLTGCTLTSNTAQDGGGIYAYNDSNSTILIDDIFYGDSAPQATDEFDGPISATYCDFQGLPAVPDSTHNFGADPLFVTPFVSGGPPADLHLRAGSPCIHVGTALPPGTLDHDGDPYAAPRPSLGAYEYILKVTNTNDSGLGSLRAAISAANGTAGSTITFTPGLSGTILLGSGLPALTKSMTIQGPGASVLAVDGAGAYRPFVINSGVTATLSGLTIQNGNSTYAGGGVLNNGVLTLTGCTLTGNSSSASGGGVLNSGTVTLTGCTLTGNSASASGGGVYNDGTATLTSCTLTANSAQKVGGGVFNAGPMTLTDDIFYGDSVPSGLAELDGTHSVTATYCDIQQGGYTGNGNLNADPRLAPLGDYGGPTQTFALLPGSPCLGAGTNAGLTADQRGVSIPQNGRYDIGAFESQGFTVKATQGSGQSAMVSTAFAQSLTATVTANDPAQLEPVAGGVLTFTAPPTGASATFSPAPAPISNTGAASVKATANSTPGGPYTVTADTGAGSATYSLSNTAPVGTPTANPQTVTTPFNTAKTITLTGSDPDSPPLPLTYVSVSTPAHGGLTGTVPNLTYTPTPGYSGPDSFTFKVNNGTNTSAPATVSLSIVGTPTANGQSVTTGQGTVIAVTLTGSDPNSPPRPLTYAVVTNPAHGTLSGTAPNLTYTPNGGYFGPDSFTFTVTNGSGNGSSTSSAATVSLSVIGTPTANNQAVGVAFNAATAVTLTGSDPNTPARSLTYTVVAGPAHGGLIGTVPNLTYTPTMGYHGADSFTFTVTNGSSTSNIATVSLTVATGTPTANAQSVTTPFNTAAAITLTGSDPDSPALTLTYVSVSAPAHGTLMGTAPNLTYTPTPGYSGPDSFTFKVNNGTNTSAAATVSLTVSPAVVSPPTASSQSVTTNENAAVAVTLSGSDPNSPARSLAYSVVTNPAHGALSGTAPSLTYTPTAGYFGPDSFTFKANNGALDSNTATISLTIAQVFTPTATAQSVATNENAAVAVMLTGADTNSPARTLTYTVVSNPAHGSLTGTAPNLTYTPTAGYFGPDSFTFKVNNSTFDSAPATVSLSVVGTPTANGQAVSAAFNAATAVTLTGSDPNTPARSLTYAVVTNPTYGTLSGTAPNFTYTPTMNYHGADSFTFTVANGSSTSNIATVSLTVATGTPTANAQSVTTPFNTAAAITLTGSDPDSPPLALTYAVTGGPAHGSLSGLNAATGAVTYTPAAGYYGPDSFTFTVTNGSNTSSPATVSLTVTQAPAQDVTGQVTVTRGGYARVPRTTTVGQTVTVTNTGATALTGPLSLALDALTGGVTLANATGTTTGASGGASGSPYLSVAGDLAPGASVSFGLHFSDPRLVLIQYAARVLVGPGSR